MVSKEQNKPVVVNSKSNQVVYRKRNNEKSFGLQANIHYNKIRYLILYSKLLITQLIIRITIEVLTKSTRLYLNIFPYVNYFIVLYLHKQPERNNVVNNNNQVIIIISFNICIPFLIFIYLSLPVNDHN